MHHEKVIFITDETPRTGEISTSTLRKQLHQCVHAIEKSLAAKQLDIRDVLKQTVFFAANGNGDYHNRKRELITGLKEFYCKFYPPTGFIGQPPADGALVAIELVVMDRRDPRLVVSMKDIEGIRCVVIETPWGKSVYAAGIAPTEKVEDVLHQSEEAFGLMKRILETEGMDFSDIVRQWNYIENITGETLLPDGPRQNYQVFNDVRSKYYSEVVFKNGYPAATGIGMDCGGVVLEFIAVDLPGQQKIIPIINPEQLNAHGYSREVLVGDVIDGLKQITTPKFERAKAVARGNGYYIYISGTASIRGQDTVHVGDIEKQTRVTSENIIRLVCKENLETHGLPAASADFSYSHIRVYVKYRKDIEKVKAVCDRYFEEVPALYLVSDVCRENLLVEIEGGMYLRI